MMFTILSPAKKMDFSRTLPGVETSQPVLLDQAAVLMKKLRKLGQEEIQQLMGVSEAIASLTFERFQALDIPLGAGMAGATLMVFDGDAYRGLDAGTLSGEDLQWAQNRLGVLSGLFGLLRPLDLIPPYRLEISTRLATRRGSNLYQFWGDRITNQLNEALQSSSSSVLINLASGEYFKAVRPKIIKGRIITPVFYEVKAGGEGKVMSFAAKFARGLMARYIVENRVEDPEALKEFNLDRYAFQPAASSDDTWIFSRKFIPK